MGPTPQEVAAQNMSDLLNLVKQGRSRAATENRAREQRFTQDKQISNQSSLVLSVSVLLKSVVQRG